MGEFVFLTGLQTEDNGRFYGLSLENQLDIGLSICICDGKIILNVPKETYFELGLTGTKSKIHPKERYGNQHRYLRLSLTFLLRIVIIIDLMVSMMLPLTGYLATSYCYKILSIPRTLLPLRCLQTQGLVHSSDCLQDYQRRNLLYLEVYQYE